MSSEHAPFLWLCRPFTAWKWSLALSRRAEQAHDFIDCGGCDGHTKKCSCHRRRPSLSHFHASLTSWPSSHSYCAFQHHRCRSLSNPLFRHPVCNQALLGCSAIASSAHPPPSFKSLCLRLTAWLAGTRCRRHCFNCDGCLRHHRRLLGTYECACSQRYANWTAWGHWLTYSFLSLPLHLKRSWEEKLSASACSFGTRYWFENCTSLSTT